jgi:hypothetical protein
VSGWSERRRRLDGGVDLDAVDARLDELDPGGDTDETTGARPGPVRPVAGAGHDQRDHTGPAAGWSQARRARWEPPPEPVDERAVLDLPPVVAPPGYRLDRRVVLRYVDGGDRVPGARWVTLARRWRFATDTAQVAVPALFAAQYDELAWAANWPVDTTAEVHGRWMSAHRVPVGEWRARAGVPFGVTAPELTLGMVLDVAAVAGRLRCRPATVTTYLARGQMPEPQGRVGNTPVWSPAIIDRWVASRPGPGRWRTRR